MLVCGDCGAAFAQPQKVTETHGLDTPPYEQYDACPVCYGMCILEAHYCDGCEEVITGMHVKLMDGNRYCQDCYSLDDILE